MIQNENEWYAMLDEIEQASMPSHIDMMAQLHDLEVQTEGRVQVIHITKTNPRG